jgi:hypothetical protein
VLPLEVLCCKAPTFEVLFTSDIIDEERFVRRWLEFSEDLPDPERAWIADPPKLPPSTSSSSSSPRTSEAERRAGTPLGRLPPPIPGMDVLVQDLPCVELLPSFPVRPPETDDAAEPVAEPRPCWL